MKDGQKGIRILAPIVGIRRKKDEEAHKDITKQNERTLLGFRNAYVFDVSQTDGADLPAMREVSRDPSDGGIDDGDPDKLDRNDGGRDRELTLIERR